jgi:hypothetical protein
MRKLSTSFVSAGAVLAVLSLPSWAWAASPSVPVVVKAVPAPEWNAKFDQKQGWIGGDAVYSVLLDSKRVLWLFGDTLVGKVKDGRRPAAGMVNNTIGIQTGSGKDSAIHFVTERDNKPAAFFTTSDDKGWLWPQAGVYARGKLFVFLPLIEKTKETGAFGFKQVGQRLAMVNNPADEPETWRVKLRQLPMVEFAAQRQRSWGSAILTEGDDVYVYGFDEHRERGTIRRQLTVARVAVAKLEDFTAWQFRGKEGWSEKPGDAAALADGLATEFSVSRAPGGKGYVAVYSENGLSDRIVGRFADRPEGTWSAPAFLYRCPEMAKDKGVFTYSAKAHPWAAKENELLISYCVNSWEFGRLFTDDAVYRPKFVRVELAKRE